MILWHQIFSEAKLVKKGNWWHYYMNKNNQSVYVNSMKELTNHVQHIRNTMKNPGMG